MGYKTDRVINQIKSCLTTIFHGLKFIHYHLYSEIPCNFLLYINYHIICQKLIFVDRKFTYLFTWSWITIHLFKLKFWTFGGVFIRHWSINICFYSHRCPNFWIANIFFLKEYINCFSFAHNSFSFKNMTQKLTWKEF